MSASSQSPWTNAPTDDPLISLSSTSENAGLDASQQWSSLGKGRIRFKKTIPNQEIRAIFIAPPLPTVTTAPSLGSHANERETRVKGTVSEIDAKIEAAEARTDTKFSELLGELRLINTRIDHVETRLGTAENSMSGLRLNIWLAAATAVGLVVAVFGWGSSMFGVGMDTQSIADQSARNVLQQAQPKFDAIQTQFKDLNTRFDAVIHALDNRQQETPKPEFDIEPTPKP